MDSLSLPIIHPTFQKLKSSGRFLHAIAGLLILVHAFSHIQSRDTNPVYFWCQFLIALDIMILVFAGRGLLAQMPKLNLFFRLVEAVFFSGIGIMAFLQENFMSVIIHLSLALCYLYLFYCERNLHAQEWLSFHHTGLSVPGIHGDKFFIWSNINEIHARYDSIHIETSAGKPLEFDLQKNLDFAELEQIHEFCRHYLKSGL